MNKTVSTATPPAFAFDNTYVRELEGLYVAWQPAQPESPSLLRLNRGLASELGLDADALQSPTGIRMLCGSILPEGAEPIAQAYAGHQFGGFSPQLGDGRALLLGELIDRNGARRDMALKGSGRTPFSRGGDGKAAIGPVLREYLMGEAMDALGIPTTRALAAIATGETVFREGPLPGAVLTRVASSHLRVGTFQYFAARGDTEKLKRLADYAIARHYSELRETDNPYLGLLCAVRDTQAALIARWMLIGFIHGVMNTDNMTISGETIDYGPCAFMDAYDPLTVFSSIDTQGRYAYRNQAPIANWNLARLAETLLPLIDTDGDRAIERASEALDAFESRYSMHWLDGMRTKLGLQTAQEDDVELVNGLLGAMQEERADFTLTFRGLSSAVSGDDEALRGQFADPARIEAWLGKWRIRLDRESMPAADRVKRMDRINPIVIPRNHLVERALLAAVVDRDLGPFERLLSVLERPFEARAGLEDFTRPPLDGNPGYLTYCGT